MYSLSDWSISDDGQSAEDVLQNGNRLLTGNGYLGRRGVVDEAVADDMPTTVLAGLYDRHGDKWREPVNAPDPLCVLLAVGGGAFRAGDENTVSHRQALDFRHGIYSRDTSWRLCGGASSGTLTVKAERFAHMEDVHLLCARYTLHADVPCKIVIRHGINSAVRDLNGPHLGNFHVENAEKLMPNSAARNVMGLSCTTLERKIPLTVFSSFAQPDAPDGNVKMQPEIFAVVDGSGVFHNQTLELDGGTTAVFHVYGTIFTGLDTGHDHAGNPAPAAEALVRKATAEGWESLLGRHKSCWDRIWRTGDVIIEGPDDAARYAQRCLRYSLYHLWIAAPRHSLSAGTALSIPARGLSGQTYKGAIFWDTEMFISPYFLAVMPDLAAQFIRYRIRTLPGAKRKAAAYGYRGAFFAWESQETGDDACTDFNVTDVFTGRPVRTYFSDKQIHISADVVYAVKKYVEQTGDTSILVDGAMELVLESARFFLSYLYYSPRRKRYEVLDVVGPDEYHERVNNNAFTNRMVLSVFETARDYIELLEKADPAFIAGLLDRIGFCDDLEFMKTVMPEFYMPGPDERGIIEQFDGYFRLEDCSLDAVVSRLKDKREYWGTGNGVASTTQIIKQADVVTMLTLFGKEYSAEAKKANLDYYEPRTEHGSSLSSCMYALLACETGRSDWAYPFFVKTMEVDITGKSKQFAGLVYIGGTHPAANGGAWLTAIHGFCGFSLENGEIKMEPRLPASWEKVIFTVHLRGTEYKVTVAKDGWDISAVRHDDKE
ncbi:MAG: glycoside hydrolase family 65 protein [Treponema sp.]|nr:glycoside hydrolase family 65 protein [Treponema sp.]